MDCIVLLLLLSCCGGFGFGGNRSGGGNGYGSTSSRNNGCGCNDGFAPRSGNNIGSNYSPANNSGSCQDSVSLAEDGCGCGGQGDNTRGISGSNPAHWQDFPEISRRDNDGCDCEN